MLADTWQPGVGPPNGTVWGTLATAVWAVRRSASFVARIEETV